jgi:hypothetical protein
VSELLAAADLLARGYTVYAPLNRHAGHADLIALPRGGGDGPITLEVRSGHRNPNTGTTTWNRFPRNNADHYAVVVTGEVVVYEPPIPEVPPMAFMRG